MIKYQNLVEKFKSDQKDLLLDEVVTNAFYEISKEKIAVIISEKSEIKVTNSLIEAYLDIAATKKFTTNDIIFEIRKLNKLDSEILNESLEFILDDNSKISISFEEFKQIKEHIKTKEVIDFMNESKENFIKIFDLIANYKE